jgi:hypothetical protein
MLNYLKLFVFIFVFVSACGDNDENADKTDSSSQDGFSNETQLFGSWSGIQKVSLTSQNELARSVTMLFEPVSSFTIDFHETGDKVSGEFSHFIKLGAIALKVGSSTSERIAKVGEMYDFEYEIVGDELLLKGFNQTFRLKREQAMGDAQTQNGAIDGIWLCQDENTQSSAIWRLQIEKTLFLLEMQVSGQVAASVRGSIKTGMSESNVVKTTLYVESSIPATPVKAFELSFLNLENQGPRLIVQAGKEYKQDFSLACVR